MSSRESCTQKRGHTILNRLLGYRIEGDQLQIRPDVHSAYCKAKLPTMQRIPTAHLSCGSITKSYS